MSNRIQVELNTELSNQARKLAAENDQSPQEYLRDLLRDAIALKIAINNAKKHQPATS